MSFKKGNSILSHIAKKVKAHQYLQNCKRMCKKHDFRANFSRKIRTILSINFTFLSKKLKIKMSDQLLKQI